MTRYALIATLGFSVGLAAMYYGLAYAYRDYILMEREAAVHFLLSCQKRAEMM